MQLFKTYKDNLLLAILVICYLACNMLLTYNEVYFLNLLPFAIALIYLAFVRLDMIYYIIIFCTPLSIPLIEFLPSSPIDFYIPTEPMLFGMMLIVFYKIFIHSGFDMRIFKHPVTLVILFNLFWILVTSITSTLPLVSFKFLLARIWFLISFYLLAIHVFRDPKNIGKLVWLYTLPLLIVIAYAINRHLMFGLFDKQAAHFVMNPFYRDHTSYGAILAMILFPFIGVNFFKKEFFLKKSLIWAVLGILLIALVLSYTRAAWISVLFALGVLSATLLKIKFKYLAILGIIVIAFLAQNRTQLFHKLEKNRQDSSADLAEHVQSISNIATDASNLERLNRWAAAFRMFQEKPVLGWGPGTYMFQYAPFQLSRQKTVISTNFGDLGNAHSEYIGPLAESGVLGMLSFIAIGIVSLIYGFRVYHKIEERRLKWIVLMVVLGLITYLIHATLNNFLDTDKASSLFWGYIAVIVSLDLNYRREGQDLEKINP